MFRKTRLTAILIFIILLINACDSQPVAPVPATVVPTIAAVQIAATEIASTIDPCQPPYSMQLAQRVHGYMREFDDASTLAASLTLDRVPDAIAELQRIRRAAEDEPIPACLGSLKDKEVAHMNMVINTFLGMLNGATAEDLQNGISAARALHDEYTIELAGILGATIVAPPTPAATQPPAVLTAVNTGTEAVNLRVSPDLGAAITSVLDVNASIVVIGRSADGKWAQVDVPDGSSQKAWLFVEAVTLSGSIDLVSVVP